MDERGMELSGLDDRSRAPNSTESNLDDAVGVVSTSSSVTASRGTPSKLVPARTPSQPVQTGADTAPHPDG